MLSETELKDLMLAALDGDARAYQRLLEGLRERLRRYFSRRLGSRPADLDDLVQESLMAIHAKRATFDPALPVTAWVFAIARHKLVDHYRRQGRRIHVPLEDHEDDLSVPDGSAASDARRDIESGLAALPARAQDLLRSVKINEEPIAAVSARTGLSASAVKVAVHRAFKALAVRLKDPDEDRAP